MSIKNNGDTIQQIQRIPVRQLDLDPENPRLASGRGGDTQLDLLRVLWTEMSVDEVALSIAANGFFPEEALFAVPQNPKEKDPEKKRYFVVEGNRRLAAVRLLKDEKLREKLKATDLPKITEKAKAALETLPVSIYESRKDLWQYFGFRHINGPKPWDSFSKAKYIADVKNNFDIPLDDIARSIGDQHSTVRRLYRGYVVLLQAEASAVFDREDSIRNKFYFSHLYTALDQTPFQSFVGITSANSLKANPVPKSKIKELKELMTWIYGSRERKIQPLVRTQDPDLNTLREVISDRRALSAIRANYSLDRAYEIAIGDERRFQESLTRAKESLTDAQGTVTLGYKGDEDSFELITEIVKVARSLHSTMEKKFGD